MKKQGSYITPKEILMSCIKGRKNQWDKEYINTINDLRDRCFVNMVMEYLDCLESSYVRIKCKKGKILIERIKP